jgi:hypothetical protein
MQGNECILVNIYHPNDEKGQIKTLKDIVNEVSAKDVYGGPQGS